MMTPRRVPNGFTLVEITVAVSITILVIGMIYGMYTSSQEAWDIKSAQADMQARGRRAIADMVRELRQATRTSTQTPSPNLVIPAAPNNTQATFYLPKYFNSSLTNATGITNATGAVQWETGNPIQYLYVPAGSVLRRVDNSTSKNLAINVSDARFTDQGIDPTLYSNELKITFALQAKTKRQRLMSMNFTGMVKLRN